MKTQLWSIVMISLMQTLPGCVVSPPAPAYPYPGPGYMAPIAPPIGVEIIRPYGVAPGPEWGWAYHPRAGWGWHHPAYGWRHR